MNLTVLRPRRLRLSDSETSQNRTIITLVHTVSTVCQAVSCMPGTSSLQPYQAGTVVSSSLRVGKLRYGEIKSLCQDFTRMEFKRKQCGLSPHCYAVSLGFCGLCHISHILFSPFRTLYLLGTSHPNSLPDVIMDLICNHLIIFSPRIP